MRYRTFLGVKWSQVQILSARLALPQFTGYFRTMSVEAVPNTCPCVQHLDVDLTRCCRRHRNPSPPRATTSAEISRAPPYPGGFRWPFSVDLGPMRVVPALP